MAPRSPKGSGMGQNRPASQPVTRKKNVNIIADFERASSQLPADMANSMKQRQKEVAAKRQRAQLNDDLLRLRTS